MSPSNHNGTTDEESLDANAEHFVVSQPGRGLINLGNTCYLNSAMQLLTACESSRTAIVNVHLGNKLHAHLHRSDRDSFRENSSISVTLGREILGVIASMKDSGRKDAISPEKLIVRSSRINDLMTNIGIDLFKDPPPSF
jgi:ubiquitin C-terminal hydrolase